jgi:phospholipase/carboxylesterase
MCGEIMSNKPNLPKYAGPVDWAGPDCKEGAASGLVHCIRLPQEAGGSRRVPVLVMLHGWGGDEGSMWVFKQVIPRGVASVSPRAPLDLAGDGYAWFPHRGDPLHLSNPESLVAAVEKVEKFLSQLPQLYPVDAARLILIAFSQGTVVANSLVLSRPKLVKGVALLSGTSFELPELIPSVTSLAGLPVFIAHGTQDKVVPLRASQKTRAKYQTLNADVTYNEYDVGHKMHTQGIKDLRVWVEKVLRND